MAKSSFKDLLAVFVDNTRQELQSIAADARKQGIALLTQKADDIERYTVLLASGKITKGEFEDLMRGLVSLDRIEFNKLSVDAKVRAQQVINGVGEVVIDGLLKMVKA
jgi:hypothetical protein